MGLPQCGRMCGAAPAGCLCSSRAEAPAGGTRLSLTAPQGLPLGSGMGSSAASAAAGAWAVNALFGSPLGKDTLVYAGLASEAAVSGYHADNIAPALMGGFILIR